ncbi:MAG: recombinase RecT [Mycobacterium sp.]
MGQMLSPREKGNEVRSMIEAYRDQIAQSLPKHVTPERMMRVVTNSICRTPALLNCDKTSLLGCILESAALGLVPDGVRGEAYIIPYGKTATLIVGYQGLMQLARRSGEIASLYAEVVRDGDHFEAEFGLETKLVHKVDWKGERGKVYAVYAVAKLRDGTSQFVVMTRDDVEAIRKRSRAGNNGPWKTDWDEMAKKTAIRRLCKQLPCSTEDDRLHRASTLDELGERGLQQELRVPADFDVEESAPVESQGPAPEAAPPVESGPDAAELRDQICTVLFEREYSPPQIDAICTALGGAKSGELKPDKAISVLSQVKTMSPDELNVLLPKAPAKK